ncbi:orc1/cdc6 family replication initiation protein [Halobacteria archaeon AArc-m2/3/4]|uniref:ORC1-type DNA replication protein n=1 Tax=Natronoglomus mannanivorans TaxID=2979990 RepID=A0AAP2YYS4_9EURY|nr:orc1/cdc6 family replication initiation protein [Halobacteria archaeon AArc-xg1-1]MCU4975760.1 orc1/cdc6 family replication initiation protein [Halobacteria archaeon AArc-m2/3/4]
MASDESDGRDPLFRYDDPIFADERLLEITHLPGPDRIVGRDDQMLRVADALNPAIFGSKPSHLFIFGKTGTGKSLISRSITQRVITEAERDDINVKYAFIDCGEQNTEASIVKTVAQVVNEPERSGVTVPDRGLGTGDYYKRLWDVIDRCTDVTIVILDEIDMLEDDEVLRKLSRAGENRRISDSSIGIVGISNKIDFPDNLSERVKSSLSRDELVFPPYDANQLIDILNKRRDAFHEEVITDEVIPLTAALAAQEHGDARKAIDILRNAGRLAKKRNDARVTEEHVRAAKEKTEADRFSELIEGSPQQAKAILYALTLLTENSTEDEFPTKIIYSQYKQITGRLELDILSERRVQEILQEQNFLNVIQSEREGRGRGRGAHAKHRLLEDPEIVKKVLLRDSRLSMEE